MSQITPVLKTTTHRPSVFDINFNTTRFVKEQQQASQALTPTDNDSSSSNQRLKTQLSWMENLTPIQINNNTIEHINYNTPSTNNLARTPMQPQPPILIVPPNSTTRSLYNILDHFYKIVNEQLIQHQSLTTGLFPKYSNGEPIGHIEETLYCTIAIWSLRQCYSKVDTDQGRTYHLGQIAVKAMRGILFCWMKQADKLEKFKADSFPKNALHSKFSILTGQEIEDLNYGHLQINVISLYLITLAQMTTSNLQIIYSIDEVNFIQNLVFYIERAYRIPDYGMHERGSKYNNNECELHASSIGMAKAALESMNGFNLYGDNGCSWSVVYVDIDAHNRNRSTLETLLPRESSSKNTSASLLNAVGFPSFSVHNQNIIRKTIAKCVRRLEGNYGYKRYLRDGENHILEDKRKPFYDSSELKNFDGTENEYPIYFAFNVINNIFSNNLEASQSYYDKLKNLIIETSEGPRIPYFYYVPKHLIESEKQKPGSQTRLPSNEVNKGSSHLCTQAIWIICQLLVEKLLLIQDLDPIKRYLQPSERPRQSKRYSTFKGIFTDLTVNIACIAESVRLQQMLANYGIQAQTPHQVEPIELWPPSELVKVHKDLGANSKLKLSGRPTRPIGCLGTSKLYRICSQTVLCYPLTFEINDFYMSSDLALLLDDVKNDIEFLSKCWKLHGRPIYVFLIREQNLRGPQRNELLELLSQFKQGNVNGVPVRMERLQTLISSACLEHLDFLDEDNAENVEYLALKELENDNSQYKSLNDLPKLMNINEDSKVKLDDFFKMTLNELLSTLQTTTIRFTKAVILHELFNRHGYKLQIQELTIEEMLKQLSSEAASVQNWKTVRYCTAVLHKTVDSLAPSITNILVRGKILTVGVFGHEEVEISKPLSPDHIKEILYDNVFKRDVFQAVLIQELIININKYISTSPEIFDGIMKLRLGWILEVMKQELEASKINDPDSEEPLDIYGLSPNEIKQLVYYILICNSNTDRNFRTIYQKRQLDGALNRVPIYFYEQIWFILNKSPKGIKIYDYLLPQQPTLSDMTDYELNFSIKIEEMLSKIDEPVMRQMIVEMIVIIYTILCRNPELKFNQVIELDKMVNNAIELYCSDKKMDQINRIAFFNECSSINNGTSAYLSRICIEKLLKSSYSPSPTFDSESDSLDNNNEPNCRIS